MLQWLSDYYFSVQWAVMVSLYHRFVIEWTDKERSWIKKNTRSISKRKETRQAFSLYFFGV